MARYEAGARQARHRQFVGLPYKEAVAKLSSEPRRVARTHTTIPASVPGWRCLCGQARLRAYSDRTLRTNPPVSTPASQAIDRMKRMTEQGEAAIGGEDEAAGSDEGAVTETPRNPDTLPTRADPSGKCPRCGRISNFNIVVTQKLRSRTTHVAGYDAQERVSVLNCQGCAETCVVIEEFDTSSERYRGVLWWPTPEVEGLDGQIPKKVAEAYREGVRCLAVQAPHAAVAMFRTALAQIVEDKGSEEAKEERKPLPPYRADGGRQDALG